MKLNVSKGRQSLLPCFNACLPSVCSLVSFTVILFFVSSELRIAELVSRLTLTLLCV